MCLSLDTWQTVCMCIHTHLHRRIYRKSWRMTWAQQFLLSTMELSYPGLHQPPELCRQGPGPRQTSVLVCRWCQWALHSIGRYVETLNIRCWDNAASAEAVSPRCWRCPALLLAPANGADDTKSSVLTCTLKIDGWLTEDRDIGFENVITD